MEKICPECSGTYLPSPKHKKFCCKRCANTYTARERRHRLSTTVYGECCKECNKPISKPRRLFCCVEHKNTFNRREKYGSKFQSKSNGRDVRTFLRRLLNRNERAALSLEFLEELYTQQNGNCAISGIPMTWKVGQGRVSTNISLDRKNSNIGYSRDNVQLVCYAINLGKSSFKEEEFVLLCNGVSLMQVKQTPPDIYLSFGA